jgi:cytochrome P450
VVAAILSFILVMTLYPDIQAKVHEEIDRVIGQERLPDYTDQESLPYLEACRKELLRWNTVVPLGNKSLHHLVEYIFTH